MIIQPKIRGFICTTAHPVGCAKNVQEQIEYIKTQPQVEGPKKALIIGASTGYGLAVRIAAAFGSHAATLGVFFEKPAIDNRTATAGWYNSVAFEKEARAAGLYARSINGDAFSDAVKAQTIETIRKDLGQVDLVVYSLASPRRTHPKTGEVFSSVLKPLGKPFRDKTVNFHTGIVSEVALDPGNDEDIRQTVAVMGGEDWEMWIHTLNEAGVLAQGAQTVAFSYIGPELTKAIYRDGTIGRAKDDLEVTAHQLSDYLAGSGGHAYVSVNKAVVTQSSSAIPVVPLYISLLFRIMKEMNLHEGCIEQMYRLLAEKMYRTDGTPVDGEGRIRLDDLEMRADVQDKVAMNWRSVDTDNLASLSDIEGYRSEFLRMFGFGLVGVDYEVDVDPR